MELRFVESTEMMGIMVLAKMEYSNRGDASAWSWRSWVHSNEHNHVYFPIVEQHQTFV